MGRFLQTDPIDYTDDYNLYAYVGNDPANRSDPTGMQDVNQNTSSNGSCSTGTMLGECSGVQVIGGSGRSLGSFLSDAAVGFGDGVYKGITFGLGDLGDVRDAFGISSFSGDQDVYSGASTIGSIQGGVTLGGGVGLLGKGRAGFEFSHAVGARHVRNIFSLSRSAEARLSRAFGNGMYVPKWFHALTDVYRFPGGWMSALPKLPGFMSAPLRIPSWITGGAMGYCEGGPGC